MGKEGGRKGGRERVCEREREEKRAREREREREKESNSLVGFATEQTVATSWFEKVSLREKEDSGGSFSSEGGEYHSEGYMGPDCPDTSQKCAAVPMWARI